MFPPHLDWIVNAVFIVLPAVALLLQYRTRRTAVARLLLVATPLVAVLVFLLAPTTALIEHGYPQASGAGAPQLSLVTGPEGQPPQAKGDLLTVRGSLVVLSVPLRVAGVDDRTEYVASGVRTTVSGQGVQFSSPFYNAFGPQITGGSPFTMGTFYLPMKLFGQIHNTPVDLHLQFASEHTTLEKTQTWKATGPRFDVPGHGVCSFPAAESLAPGSSPEVTCRYAFAPPEINVAEAAVSPGGCGGPLASSVPGRARLGGRAGLLEFDPVVTVPLSFRTGDPNPEHSYALCPGTEVHFVEGKKLPDSSLPVEIRGITLDPYAVRRQGPTVDLGTPGRAPVQE